jgi:hypothetical protein
VLKKESNRLLIVPSDYTLGVNWSLAKKVEEEIHSPHCFQVV